MIDKASLAAPLVTYSLEKVQRDLERWRRTRRQRARIPEPLWTAAAKVAGQCGLTRTARILRLDYNGLKQRLALTNSPAISQPTASPAFMELLPALTAVIPECLMELEDGRGTRLKIHLKGAGSQEVLSVSRGLWSLPT